MGSFAYRTLHLLLSPKLKYSVSRCTNRVLIHSTTVITLLLNLDSIQDSENDVGTTETQEYKTFAGCVINVVVPPEHKFARVYQIKKIYSKHTHALLYTQIVHSILWSQSNNYYRTTYSRTLYFSTLVQIVSE